MRAMIRLNQYYGIEVSANDYSLVKFGVSEKGKSQGKETKSIVG